MRKILFYLNGVFFFLLGFVFNNYFSAKIPSFKDYKISVYKPEKELRINLNIFPKKLPQKEKKKIISTLSHKVANFAGEFLLFDINIDNYTKKIFIYSLKRRRFLKNLNINDLYLPKRNEKRFHEEFSLEFYPESKLIKLVGLPSGEKISGVYYYLFKKEKFKKVAFFSWE